MADDILVRLRMAGEQFSRDLRDSFGQVQPEAERAGTGAGMGFVKGFVGAWGAAQIGSLIGNTIRQALDYGAELDAASKRIGVNVEALQEWRHAAQEFGVSAGDLDDLLGDLTQKIGEADGGSRKAQQAFVDLGVGFQDTTGRARETDAVMNDVITRLNAMEDPAERARVGTALLGEEYRKLEPLVHAGADAIADSVEELRQLQAVLSEEEIRQLQETNAKFDQMKTVLSARIAGVVGENADAIMRLAEGAANLAAKAIQAADSWLTLQRALGQRADMRGALPSDMAPGDRAAAEREIDARLGLRETVTGSFLGGLIRTKNYAVRPDGNFPDVSLYTDAARDEVKRWLTAPTIAPAAGAAAPRVTAPGGRARPQRQSAAAREAERAAKEAIRNEERLRESIARTIQAQEDSLRVEEIRADRGEVAAAAEEARLAFLRQHPLALHDTVEELAAALGITKQLTEEDRKRLQLLIDQGDAAEQGAASAAGSEAQERIDRAEQERREREDEAAQRAAEHAARAYARAHEEAIRDVADIYEDLFTNGVDSVWDHFKAEGQRALAEIAAQWTIAMVSGQKFDLGQAANAAFGRSPISSIFFGGGIFGGAANDNLPTTAPSPHDVGQLPQGGTIGGVSGALGGAAMGAGIGSLSANVLELAGIDMSNTGASIGGAIGSFIPIPGGSIIGAVAGGLLGNLFKSKPYGTAQLTGADSLSVTGKGDGRAAGAGTLGGAVQDGLSQIADALGAELGSFLVSIGTYRDNFRVSTVGQTGKLKGRTGNERRNEREQGLYDFDTEEEAIAFAIRDAISDGALKGISMASQRIIANAGKDLDAAIEKAALIEGIPDALAQRLDPLNNALDEIYRKHERIAEALREGAATEEQIAEARQLWELEKADAIAAIGDSSETLKDYLLSLQAGGNSPLSLRKQEAEAEEALAPYIAQIEAAASARDEVERLRAQGGSAEEIEAAEKAARLAAGKIDQSGFTDASQLLLGISRQMNASSEGFFEDYERIRALTQQGISLIDGATPSTDDRDPYSSLVANNTGETVSLLEEIRDLLRQGANDNGGSAVPWRRDRFFEQQRAFSSQ